MKIFFCLHTLGGGGGGGGLKGFFRGHVWLISHNSKTTASRKTIFTSIDSETQVSYLCSIHYGALTALFFELFSKNCFYPFLLAISLWIKGILSRPHRWPIGGRTWPKASWNEKSNVISGWIPPWHKLLVTQQSPQLRHCTAWLDARHGNDYSCSLPITLKATTASLIKR